MAVTPPPIVAWPRVGARPAPLPAASLAMRRRPGSVRIPVGQFSLGLECSAGTRFSEAARGIAASVAHHVNAWTPICDEYLNALARAEAEHLRGLKQRGCRIIFAATVPAGIAAAAVSRRRHLTSGQRAFYEREYGRDAGVAAVYVEEFDSLVFPTSYRDPDLEHAVLHELGHALTYAWAREHGDAHEGLLHDLPDGIEELIASPAYPQGMDGPSVAIRVSEVLAEVYVYLLVERADELPLAVVLALTRIVPS